MRTQALSTKIAALALTALVAATGCSEEPDTGTANTDTDAPAATGTGDSGSDNAEGTDTGTAPPSADATVVTHVIDGDSVEFTTDGQTVEARLIGINAPEYADCQGPSSTEALAGIVEGQAVDVIDYGTDRFGRALVDLVINGESVNLAVVRAGWALAHHTDEHPDADRWIDAMVEAADNGLGMWDLPDLCPRADASIRIGDAQPDPPGPDDEVLDQEWIELVNTGTEVARLDGWFLRDESTSNRIPLDGLTIGPGDTARVVTGCGTDDANTFHWCNDAGIWSNRGETALLLGPSGSIEDWALL